MGCFKDLSRHTFGRLTAIAPVGKNKKGNYLWRCSCLCGEEATCSSSNLQSGNTASCGCAQGVHGGTAGGQRSPEYLAWVHMKERCSNPRHKQFKDYGGRGITVFDRWERDYLAFYTHIGARPSPSHSLDRIDNDGNYEPGNVRWATRSEQQCNTRRARTNSALGRRCSDGS